MEKACSLIVPNITEGEYANREGVDYYCIARDNIGFEIAIRSRSITVYYACEFPYPCTCDIICILLLYMGLMKVMALYRSTIRQCIAIFMYVTAVYSCVISVFRFQWI